MVVADFNGDGIPDLAVANLDSFLSQGKVSILLGNGDGTFQGPVSYAAGGQARALAVGDFNGDGTPDLAVANAASGTVGVLLNHGDGTFANAVKYPAGSEPIALTVADVTGNGIPDLVVADSGYPNAYVYALLGNGDGTFQGAKVSPAPLALGGVSVADFTGDGIPDLVVTNTSFTAIPGQVSVLMGNGDGTFHASTSYAVGDIVYTVAIGDFNGDGTPDFAAVEWDPTYSSSYSFATVFLGKGDGTFVGAVNYGVGSAPNAVAVGDLTGNGVTDLVVEDSFNKLSVLLGNGDGTFQTPQVYADGTGVSLALGDFTNDGVLDMVTANGANNSVSVLIGNGNGTFQAKKDYPVSGDPEFVAVADLTGDGNQDIITATKADNTVTVLLGNGNGTFQAT